MNNSFILNYERAKNTGRSFHNYYQGNILDIEELGITFRVSEKLARLKHLYIKHESPKNESIDDTWIDIATYAVIVLMYRKSWFRRLELKDKSTK